MRATVVAIIVATAIEFSSAVTIGLQSTDSREDDVAKLFNEEPTRSANNELPEGYFKVIDGDVVIQKQNNAGEPKHAKHKKPGIVVSGIDDDGKKVDAVVKNDTDNEETLEIASTHRPPKLHNVTESPEEVFLPAEGAAEQEHSSSLAIFFVLFIMVLSIFLIHFMLQAKFHYIPESLAIVFLGAAIGAVMKLLPSEGYKRVESFSPTTFFLVLLPPIIFESGYNLHKGEPMH